jgi:hypothetical protein
MDLKGVGVGVKVVTELKWLRTGPIVDFAIMMMGLQIS